MDAPGDFFFFFSLYDASPSRAVFNRRQSVGLKPVSDGWEGKGLFSPVSVPQTSLQPVWSQIASVPASSKESRSRFWCAVWDILNLIKSVSQFCNIDLEVISVSGCTT